MSALYVEIIRGAMIWQNLIWIMETKFYFISILHIDQYLKILVLPDLTNLLLETKKKWNFGIKFITTLITSVLTSLIVCEVIITPNWATFAACLLKLFAVSMQGVFGYKMGFENIVVDTVEYMRDQIDLMQNFLEYVKLTPIDFKNVTAENDGQSEPENSEETPPNGSSETAKIT